MAESSSSSIAQEDTLDETDVPGAPKKVKRDCRFKQEWRSHGMLPSKKGPTFAYCKTCNADINIASGGAYGIKKHLSTSKHQEVARASSCSSSLISMFQQSPIEDKVTRAEILFASFVAEHNLAFMAADHFTRLTKAMFPDSKIAKAFSSARTKTSCIVRGALHPHLHQPVVELCQNGPFSILCDEGNDVEDKNFAILVRLWDEKQGKPMTRFLDMPICNIGTAEKLFEAIHFTMHEKSIPWSNVVGFESDTTNVMVGKHNSVLSRVRGKQPNVFSQGCVCHLANLCLLAGVKVLPVDVDDFLVDLFYFFDKSAKRREELSEFQEFTNTPQSKILKHVKTRWLSLEKVVKRVLQQWDALYGYFDRLSESDSSARVVRLNQHLNSHLTKLVFIFLDFSLEAMCKFNATFQSSMAMLPALKSEVYRLLKVLLGRFIIADVIQNIDVGSLNLCDQSIQLPDDQLGIGHSAWGYISSEDDCIDSRVKRLFFSGVRDFYCAVATTILKKFPFNDSVLDDVTFLFPDNRCSVDIAVVSRMATRFQSAVPEQSLDALEEEVLDYKLAPMLNIPTGTTTDVCSYWQQVGQMRVLNGALRFPNLTKLAKCVLALPVSNADTERVFSIVKKIVTSYRTDLEQSTLCALLSCKLNCDFNCFELETPTDLLRRAKGATVEYNRSHST